jgi:hypothetical protein
LSRRHLVTKQPAWSLSSTYTAAVPACWANCSRDDGASHFVVSDDFFVNLLDMGTEWCALLAELDLA